MQVTALITRKAMTAAAMPSTSSCAMSGAVSPFGAALMTMRNSPMGSSSSGNDGSPSAGFTTTFTAAKLAAKLAAMTS